MVKRLDAFKAEPCFEIISLFWLVKGQYKEEKKATFKRAFTWPTLVLIGLAWLPKNHRLYTNHFTPSCSRGIVPEISVLKIAPD